LWIDSSCAPIRPTPWRSSTPASESATVRFRAVCPPSVGRITSGFSRSMIFSTEATVIGST
jgi:hypothetical protein